MRVEGLAAFVATVDRGSLTAAAAQLKLAPSVVSDRLAQLEQGLGVVLLQRSTRRVSLTDDGATLLPRARVILRDLENAASELAERRGGLAGPLRISAPLSFGVLHLGPALCAFAAEHPHLELILDLDDRFVDVAAGGFDAVIRIGQVADGWLIARPLAPSRRVIVASPGYLDRFGAPSTLEDLSRHRVISYTNRGGDEWRFRRNGRTVIVRPTPAFRVNNGDLIRQGAEAGLGLALLPSFIASDALAAGRLRRVKVDGDVDVDTVHLVYPKTGGVPSKVSSLVGALRGRFGRPPYWDAALE